MIQVVERVARVLGTFTHECPELTLTECARSAGLNKSSAYRLLESLEATLLVERNGTHWRLGPLTVALAEIRLGSFNVRQAALTHMRDLRSALRSAVALGVPEGSDMIFVETLDSPDDVYRVSVRIGSRAPIWAGGAGKAVLSQLDPQDRDSCLDVSEWRHLPIDVRGRILEEIDNARTRGYARDDGQFYPGMRSIAAPVLDATDHPIAALSVFLPAERLTEDFERRIAADIIAAVSEIQSAMRPTVTLRSNNDGQTVAPN